MAAVKELIRSEGDGSMSFGDYTQNSKQKLDNYEYNGDIYKVKTFQEITKLERNGMFVYESVPGTAVSEFREDGDGVEFQVEGNEDAQITVELAEDTEYEVFVDDNSIGKMSTNLGGKLSINVELGSGTVVRVRISR